MKLLPKTEVVSYTIEVSKEELKALRYGLIWMMENPVKVKGRDGEPWNILNDINDLKPIAVKGSEDFDARDYVEYLWEAINPDTLCLKGRWVTPNG